MNKTIEISESDQENIVQGLGMLVELYTDSLKELSYNAKIHGDILECELAGIDDHIERLQSASNTLDLFCEKYRDLQRNDEK